MANKRKYKKCCICGYQHNIRETPILPRLCPNEACKVLYWEKPLIERELMLLQNEYFASDRKNEKPFQDMVIIVERILHNIIASKLKGSAVYLEEEKRHDLVMDSLLVFMEKYSKNPDFKIAGSFIGYLDQMVLNPLYHPKKKLREKSETSLSTPIGGDNNLYLYDLMELVEGMEGSEEYILNKYQAELQVDAITYLLESIFIQCVVSYDLRTAIIVLNSIYMQLNSEIKEEDLIEYWQFYTNELRVLSDYNMKILYDFVRTEIADVNQVMSYENYIEKFGRLEEETEEEEIEESVDGTILVKEYL